MGLTIAQTEVFRCGNEYTTSAAQAFEQGCTRIGGVESAPVDGLYQHPVVLEDQTEGEQLSGGAKLAILLLSPVLLLLALRMFLKSRRASVSSPPDDQTYALVAQEIEAGKIDKGLWTRAFAENEGDESKTRAAYIRHRAQQLRRSPPGSQEEP